MTAAPCRENACSASLLPAPMPPVIAMWTGLVLFRDGRFGRHGLVGRRGVELVADVDGLALDRRLGGFALGRIRGGALLERRRLRRRARVGEDILGQVEV